MLWIDAVFKEIKVKSLPQRDVESDVTEIDWNVMVSTDIPPKTDGERASISFVLYCEAKNLTPVISFQCECLFQITTLTKSMRPVNDEECKEYGILLSDSAKKINEMLQTYPGLKDHPIPEDENKYTAMTILHFGLNQN